MVTNARLFVDAPTSEPLPYGLMSVVQERSVSDPHALAGITWQSLCPGGGTTYDSCLTSAPAASGTPESKAANTFRTTRGATPFTVYAEVDCSPIDFYERGDQIAETALARSEQLQIERVLWTGLTAGVEGALPHLAENTAVNDPNSISTIVLQPAASVVTGVGVNIVDGLGLLEAAMSTCYNGVGIVHVPSALFPTLDALGLVHVDGNQLRTRRGNLVSVGSGYLTTGPDGVVPPVGQSWMYGTGPAMLYRGPAKLVGTPRESFVRSVNTLKMIAERTYVIGFDCCLYAALVYKRSIIATSTLG